jgi:hypothetical protein
LPLIAALGKCRRQSSEILKNIYLSARDEDGVNVISGKAQDGKTFKAVPYYAVGNRGGKGYQVWSSAIKTTGTN